jgi:DNA-binding MarR family transcriptional regulator
VARQKEDAETQTRRLLEQLGPAMAETSVANRIGFLLNKAAIDVRGRFEKALQSHKLTPRHFGVLSFIAEVGPLSQQQIAENIACDRTTMVALVDELEQAGLARREPDSSDRRKYSVVITEGGRKLLRKAGEIAISVEKEFLSGFSKQEQETLRTLLKRIVFRPR